MPVLLVLLKFPTPGKVKTRIAASIGEQAAADLYRNWIRRVLDQMQPVRDFAEVVAYFDGGPCEAFGEWHALAGDWWQQPDGDFGLRLETGFAAGHALGGPVVAVGTDCLDVTASTIRDALMRLQDSDAVFGPADDGGYYLAGTARPLPGLYENIPWSTRTTLQSQLERCRQNGWTTTLLPTMSDLDTWDDWTCYQETKNNSKCTS